MFTPLGDVLERISGSVSDLPELVRAWDELSARLEEIGIKTDLASFLKTMQNRVDTNT